MGGEDKTFRFRTSGSDGLRVQAYAPVGDGRVRTPIIFRCDQISYIFAGEQEGVSCIRMNSGVVIPVRLGLAELDEAIYRPTVESVDGNGVIDLSAVTKMECAPANDVVQLASSAPEKGTDIKPKVVGDVMPDGTIYAGISPETNQPMYAAAKDAPIAMAFNEAVEYARELQVGGKKDFRLPTREELKVLFSNREKGALKDSFNKNGGLYWSRTAYGGEIYAQYFRDAGASYAFKKDTEANVRCIRSVAPANGGGSTYRGRGAM